MIASSVVAALLYAAAALCIGVVMSGTLERRRLRQVALRHVGYKFRHAPGAQSAGVSNDAPTGILAKLAWRVRSWRSADSRRELIASELAPALQLVIGQLRIGRNVVASIAEVADSVPDPLGSIFRDVVSEARLGTPIDEVLGECARRENDRHLGVVASAIGLQARHGGSLVDILGTVVETIEEEDRLRRDIKSVTADGRLSAIVLMGMPPVMLLLVSVFSPGYAAPLVNDPIGRIMALVGLFLGAVGWKWLRVLASPQVIA